jgi:hypothetical protein
VFKNRDVVTERKLDPNGITSALSAVIGIQSLSQHARLAADQRVVFGRVVRTAFEHFEPDQILVDSRRLSLKRQFTDVAEKPPAALSPAESLTFQYLV